MSLQDLIDWVAQGVEAAGAALVLGGVVVATFRILRVPFMKSRPPLAPVQIRIGLGMFLALGLEFLLAADILRTAVSPTFYEVGVLAAIAAIRTALNFFLGRELVEGQRQMEAYTSAGLNPRVAGPPGVRPGNDQPEPTRDDAPGGLKSAWLAAIRGPWLPGKSSER